MLSFIISKSPIFMKAIVPVFLVSLLMVIVLQPACKKQADPTKVAVKSFTVTQIPFVRPDGTSWEDIPLVEGGPDVYWVLADENDSIYYGTRSIRFDNVTKQHLPLVRVLSPPLVLSPLSRNYFIKVYDYDLIGGDDLMATMGPFSFASYLKEAPDMITLSGDSAIVQIGIEWKE